MKNDSLMFYQFKMQVMLYFQMKTTFKAESSSGLKNVNSELTLLFKVMWIGITVYTEYVRLWLCLSVMHRLKFILRVKILNACDISPPFIQLFVWIFHYFISVRILLFNFEILIYCRLSHFAYTECLFFNGALE